MDARPTRPFSHLAHRRSHPVLATIVVLVVSACGGAGTPSSGGGDGDVPKVFGAFATQIEEPWDGVIHSALLAE